MKKQTIFLAIVLFILQINIYGQGIYFQLYGGMGVNQNYVIQRRNLAYVSDYYLSYEIGSKAGYEFLKNLDLKTGVGFVRNTPTTGKNYYFMNVPIGLEYKFFKRFGCEIVFNNRLNFFGSNDNDIIEHYYVPSTAITGNIYFSKKIGLYLKYEQELKPHYQVIFIDENDFFKSLLLGVFVKF